MTHAEGLARRCICSKPPCTVVRRGFSALVAWPCTSPRPRRTNTHSDTQETMPSTFNVDAFEVSLYFKEVPQINIEALIQAWEAEGYGIELETPGDGQQLKAFRSSIMTNNGDSFDNLQLIELSTVQAIDHDDVSECYPGVCQPIIDYDRTYLINPQTAWADFQTARHEVRLNFRMREVSNRQLPHMELLAVLNAIHQQTPVHAMQLHHLGLLVGQVDAAEFLDYASDLPDQGPQFCPMLAFGIFCMPDEDEMEDDPKSQALIGWTTGLRHFGPHEFWMQSATHPAVNFTRVMLNLGHELIAGRELQAGESASVAELYVDMVAADDMEPPSLELVLA